MAEDRAGRLISGSGIEANPNIGRRPLGSNITPNTSSIFAQEGQIARNRYGKIGYKVGRTDLSGGGGDKLGSVSELSKGLGSSALALAAYKTNGYLMIAGIVLQTLGTFAQVFANNDPIETGSEKINRERYERAQGIARRSDVSAGSADAGMKNFISTYQRSQFASAKREKREGFINRAASSAHTELEQQSDQRQIDIQKGLGRDQSPRSNLIKDSGNE